MNSSNRSFTLMELLLVVVILGVIAGFAIPSYQKAMARQKVKRLILTANLIAGAQEIYKARNGRYWCEMGSPECPDLNSINANLGINIVPESGEMTYWTFTRLSWGNRFKIIITDGEFVYIYLESPPLNITCSNLSPMDVCP